MADSSDPLTLAPLAQRYVAERQRRGELQPITVKSFRNVLGQFAKTFGRRPIEQLGPRAVERHLERIRDLAPSTRRNQLSIIRYFCRWLVAQRLIPVDPTISVSRIKQPRKVPRALNADQVRQVLDACQDERDRLVIWLMVGCGLRCVEVSRLEVADLDRVNQTVHVVGKGGHERILPMPQQVRSALAAYLSVRGEIGGPLIRSKTQPHSGVSPTGLSQIGQRIFRDAGIKSGTYDGCSPHALRSTAASDVLDRCGDLTLVQEMLGHANLSTTSIYLRRASIKDMRQAMEGRSYDRQASVATIIEMPAAPTPETVATATEDLRSALGDLLPILESGCAALAAVEALAGPDDEDLDRALELSGAMDLSRLVNIVLPDLVRAAGQENFEAAIGAVSV
jgi:integrase/recombinase XerC